MVDVTRSLAVAGDVSALLRARNPLLWIVTGEEARVERFLIEAAADAGYVTRMWDIATGFTEVNGSRFGNEDDEDPGNAMRTIRTRAGKRLTGEKDGERCVWIMRDMPAWITPPVGTVNMRRLRNLARFLPGVPRANAQAIVILSPNGDVPAELANHTTVIEWPLPDRDEIAEVLDAAIDGLPETLKAKAANAEDYNAAVDAAVGLSGEEAAACYAKSLVQKKRIDPSTVAQEKKRVIARAGVLQWYEPLKGGLDAVGGLGNVKKWLGTRAGAYTARAREYGLPAPRGALLVGVPGCGKSLTAKACATAWNVPLIKMDLGALKSKFVGESEANIRKAFATIEAIGRCVVWLDEIEKALGGATDGAADGGVSTDALGAILNWMQERPGQAFVLATANDVSKLPPELMRKGRFDEIFFIDVPKLSERIEVLKAAVKEHGRTNAKIDYAAVAEVCNGFTGAELAALVPDALFVAFNDGGREITTDDLLNAKEDVVPLTKTAAEKIEALRKWATERARPASAPDADTVVKAKGGSTKRVRQLDIRDDGKFV